MFTARESRCVVLADRMVVADFFSWLGDDVWWILSVV